MISSIMRGMLVKKLVVQKAPNVQGGVKIHFPSESIKDIVLTDFASVDVYKRINITDDQIKVSNLESLVLSGILVVR